jgi:hypothetical protein
MINDLMGREFAGRLREESTKRADILVGESISEFYRMHEVGGLKAEDVVQIGGGAIEALAERP